MKGLSQKSPDFKETERVANSTEISPTTLRVLEEVYGNHLYHCVTDKQVDIVLDTGQNEPILIRLDDVKPDIVGFIKNLKPGEPVGIFRLDAIQQFFVRRVSTKVREWKPPKTKV